MNVIKPALSDPAEDRCVFLRFAGWPGAACEALTGDASARRYYRVRLEGRTAILMDASLNRESLPAFLRIGEHLRRLGLQAPAILARDPGKGLLLLEDFGDDTFTRLLEGGGDPEALYRLATEVLISLHRHPAAVPDGLRVYDPENMLADIELFLEWRTPGISAAGRAEFREVWRAVLPLAQAVPSSLLLRDYHAANLMWVAGATGLRRAGLLDFQDAYQGPVTYDLVSLLEDARRDLPAGLPEKMLAFYRGGFPGLDPDAFETSLAILAAQRHTRVLAIFERLSRREGKAEYKDRHGPRVQRRLQKALGHPILAGVKHWMDRHAP